MNPARIIGHTGPILGACNKAVALGVELLCAKGKGNKRLVGWGGHPPDNGDFVWSEIKQ